MKKDCSYCEKNNKGICIEFDEPIFKPVKIIDCKFSKLDMDKINALNKEK